jgi:hypothetical protein
MRPLKSRILLAKIGAVAIKKLQLAVLTKIL